MPEIVSIAPKRPPRARLKRKPFRTDQQKKRATKRRKNDKERELWASFGLIRPAKPRYVGLQGILWFLTSKAVRMEDFALYGGLCVDGCGVRVERWQDADCGHFQTAGRSATRFLRENLALQTRACNTKQRQGDARHYSFGKELNRRYGEGTAERMIELSEKGMVMTEEYVRAKITEYTQMVEKLETKL